jgi:hypothetical protein
MQRYNTNRAPSISTSFVQDQKHLTKSERFQAIQPSQIATVLDGHGFDLISLKTGHARNADRQDFQNTVAVYQSRDTSLNVGGTDFRLVFKVPHLYGALIGMLGLYRLVCKNGLVVGARNFETVKVKHLGDPVSELNALIPRLVAQRQNLNDLIGAMQARQVSPIELRDLALTVANIRLQDTQNIAHVHAEDLLRVRRAEDRGADLFSVLNVLQENALRFGMRYQTRTVDTVTGQAVERNMNARRVSEQSIKAIDLNASIWDAATALLTA